MTVTKYDIKSVLVDNESSVDVLFYDIFLKINLTRQLRQISTLLIRFSENLVAAEGEITLPIMVGQKLRQSIVQLTFLVVRVSSIYNAILGRPNLNALKVIISTYHLFMHFLTKELVKCMAITW